MLTVRPSTSRWSATISSGAAKDASTDLPLVAFSLNLLPFSLILNFKEQVVDSDCGLESITEGREFGMEPTVGSTVGEKVGFGDGATVGSEVLGMSVGSEVVGESVGAIVGFSVGATVGDTVGNLVWIIIAKTVSMLTIVSTAPESDWPPMVISVLLLKMAVVILLIATSSSTCWPYNSIYTPSVETDGCAESQPQLLLTPPAMSSWLTLSLADAMKNAR